jgi:hypothetical protein
LVDKSTSIHNAQTSHLKFQHLQAILKVILGTLLDAQSPHALDGVELSLGGVMKTVNIHVPVNFIIEDLQGRDKICVVLLATLAK